MPFLEEMSAHLFDMMPVHDIEDFISNALAFAAATDCSQAQPSKRTRNRFVAEDIGKFLGQAILGMGKFARFGVVIALPGKLANGGEAQPNEKQREAIDVVADAIE